MTINNLEVDDNIRDLFECEAIRVDSLFITKPEEDPVTVIICRVDPTGQFNTAAKPVVRFSEKAFAIPETVNLRLGTSKYYRTIESNVPGIRDELEGGYQQETDLFSQRREAVPASGTRGIGRITWRADDFWLLCTSLKPRTNAELRRLQERFKAESTTEISDPVVFAQELGKGFAQSFAWSDVKLEARDQLRIMLRPVELGTKLVWVYHGPVAYPTNTDSFLSEFPKFFRERLVLFQKRACFQWQKEYRFTITTNGQSVEDALYLPCSPSIKRLGKRV